MLSTLLALALQASTTVNAEPTQAPVATPQIVPPDWRRRATRNDIDHVFPRSAKRRGVSGAALITCSVSKEGRLVNCAASQESPPREGFGDAALKLADKFEMRPLTKNGVPVDGGTVRIPIRFVHPNAR